MTCRVHFVVRVSHEMTHLLRCAERGLASSQCSILGSVSECSSSSNSSPQEAKATREVPDHALDLVTGDLRVGLGDGCAWRRGVRWVLLGDERLP